MENKNGLNALLVPGAHLDEYIKAVAAQYRSDLTATYGTLQKAVALLEDMARGGYTPEKAAGRAAHCLRNDVLHDQQRLGL